MDSQSKRLDSRRKPLRVNGKGQVTLPADSRRRPGLDHGGLVAFEETADGILLTPLVDKAMNILDRLGEVFRAEGVTLDEMMESGAEIREQLVREMYGPPPSSDRST
jgi:bifunctional DNA-binding transcriptional regulator/antitoxin component of YhaV-PrlF toxin-antitoxin module